MNKLLDVIGATKKGEEMLSVLGEKGLNEIYDYTLKQGQLRAYILGLVNTKRYMKTGEKQYTIITSKKEIGEFLELSSRKNNQIKDMLHFFRRKDIKAEDNKSSIYTGLIESFEFEKYQDKVIINLNKKASDMFFSKRYVKYNTHMVKSFKSKYSLGFYELFRFKKGNKRYIS